MEHKYRVGVLMGGSSSEREISLKSGRAVFQALKDAGIDVVSIDIFKEETNFIKDLVLSYNIDLAFLALHGGFGEDGRIQGILEELGIPFTGSGATASSLAMNKAFSQKIFEKAGLNVPRYYCLDTRHKNLRKFNNFPLVVKPASGGSSIGLSIVDNRKDLRSAVDLAFKFGKEVLIEEYIEGREMTVGILEDKPLNPIEIKTKRRFFDFEAKYHTGFTDYIVPAKLPKRITRELKDVGAKAHRLLGCTFFSRVDIILNKEGRPFVLEVNTIPGFTSTSLLPKAAKAAGIDFPELVIKISKSALQKKHGGFLKKDINGKKKKL